MGGLLNAMAISSQGLSVQRSRMNITAQNIANAETTKTEKGGPYRRQRVVVTEDRQRTSFQSQIRHASSRLTRTNGNHISSKSPGLSHKSDVSSVDTKVIDDPQSNFRLVYDPSHPHADDEGYVRMPGVEIITEMVDMMAASRAYEANTVAIASAKQMARNALDI